MAKKTTPAKRPRRSQPKPATPETADATATQEAAANQADSEPAGIPSGGDPTINKPAETQQETQAEDVNVEGSDQAETQGEHVETNEADAGSDLETVSEETADATETQEAPAPVEAMTQEVLEIGTDLYHAISHPNPSYDQLSDSFEDVNDDQIQLLFEDLTVFGRAILKDGKRVEPSEFNDALASLEAQSDVETNEADAGADLGTVSDADPQVAEAASATESSQEQVEPQLDDEGDEKPANPMLDIRDLDIRSVAANTAQAAAAELALQLMSPSVESADGEAEDEDLVLDVENWYNGCEALPDFSGDLAPYEVLAGYAMQRPSVVTGETLFRQAHVLGLHEYPRDGFAALPAAIQLAYGIFAKTAWHTCRTLIKLKEHAASAAVLMSAPAEPGRSFPLHDEDDPVHAPGERGWR